MGHTHTHTKKKNVSCGQLSGSGDVCVCFELMAGHGPNKYSPVIKRGFKRQQATNTPVLQFPSDGMQLMCLLSLSFMCLRALTLVNIFQPLPWVMWIAAVWLGRCLLTWHVFQEKQQHMVKTLQIMRKHIPNCHSFGITISVWKIKGYAPKSPKIVNFMMNIDFLHGIFGCSQQFQTEPSPTQPARVAAAGGSWPEAMDKSSNGVIH